MSHAGHARDWLGVHPSGTTPAPVSTIWGHVGGGVHTPTSGRTDGAITLVAGRTGMCPALQV